MKKSNSCESIKKPLFAAANSGNGFVSFYSDIFGGAEIKKRYIIKGGPGTGKSSFMKKVASFAESHGSSVEVYMCSSDPDSVDGIIIDRKIAIIDGTAPHSEDADIPGARDEILNLGVFWRDEPLMERFEEISCLSSQKSAAYRKAYRYLSAGLEIENINFTILDGTVKKDKMRGAADRIVEKIPKGKGGRVLAGLEGSLGMKGSVRINSYIQQSQRVYVIDDYYNSSSLFLAEIADAGLKNENVMRVSYNHISARRLDAVLFVESGICFVVEGNVNTSDLVNANRINMKRFIDSEAIGPHKTELRGNFRMISALISDASSAMKKAGEYHFLLEEIYKGCMDFNALNCFCETFCEKLIKYL